MTMMFVCTRHAASLDGKIWKALLNRAIRSLTASGLMLMTLCVVQSFEALEVPQTSITFFFNIILRYCVISNVAKDAPQTTSDQGAGADPRQLENTFILQKDSIHPSYIIGSKPGVSLIS